jgi:hypothetical protein
MNDNDQPCKTTRKQRLHQIFQQGKGEQEARQTEQAPRCQTKNSDEASRAWLCFRISVGCQKCFFESIKVGGALSPYEKGYFNLVQSFIFILA